MAAVWLEEMNGGGVLGGGGIPYGLAKRFPCAPPTRNEVLKIIQLTFTWQQVLPHIIF